jgi:TctA family transporter
LRCNPNTITMPSIEIKNWITGLVVGILGLALASLGTVLAYKQLKRTKRPDDVENGDAEIIVMRDVAVVTEEAGSPW